MQDSHKELLRGLASVPSGADSIKYAETEELRNLSDALRKELRYRVALENDIAHMDNAALLRYGGFHGASEGAPSELDDDPLSPHPKRTKKVEEREKSPNWFENMVREEMDRRVRALVCRAKDECETMLYRSTPVAQEDVQTLKQRYLNEIDQTAWMHGTGDRLKRMVQHEFEVLHSVLKHSSALNAALPIPTARSDHLRERPRPLTYDDDLPYSMYPTSPLYSATSPPYSPTDCSPNTTSFTELALILLTMFMGMGKGGGAVARWPEMHAFLRAFRDIERDVLSETDDPSVLEKTIVHYVKMNGYDPERVMGAKIKYVSRQNQENAWHICFA